MIDWTPDLASSNKPRYLAIADLIAADIKSGRLATGDRLPPQRKLASRLQIDFTTVARGYAEAQKRGLIELRVGQGTYVRSPANGARAHAPPAAPRGDIVDFSMNLPPEPNDPALIERMQAGVQEVSRDIVALLRYQGFGGSPADKDAASSWLGRRSLVPAQERIFVTPGAHPAILGAFSTLAAKGETILCEAITYPGARSIAAQLGLNLVGLRWIATGSSPTRWPTPARASAPRRSTSTRRCKIRPPSPCRRPARRDRRDCAAVRIADRRG